MSIIIDDLDELIFSFIDLPEFVSLMNINKNYYQKIKNKALIVQWNKIKYVNKYDDYNYIFKIACKFGYMQYAKSLSKRYNIHINNYDRNVFDLACSRGYLDIAKWLLDQYSSQIDIHTHNDFVFRYVCENGKLEVAKWLIDLGENCGYGRINIHTCEEYAISLAYKKGYTELTRWLIDLGENHGYGQFNQQLINFLTNKK